MNKRSIRIEADLRAAAARWQSYADTAIAPTQQRYCQEISDLFRHGADEISRLRGEITLQEKQEKAHE